MSRAPYAPSETERNWAMACHLSALCSLVGVPGFVGPLVVWLVKKDEMPLVDDQGREALNFNISVTIAVVICVAAAFVLFFTMVVPMIAILAAGAIGIYALVMTILAGIAAQKGELYRYPYCWRFF